MGAVFSNNYLLTSYCLNWGSWEKCKNCLATWYCHLFLLPQCLDTGPPLAFVYIQHFCRVCTAGNKDPNQCVRLYSTHFNWTSCTTLYLLALWSWFAWSSCENDGNGLARWVLLVSKNVRKQTPLEIEKFCHLFFWLFLIWAKLSELRRFR